MEQSRKLSEMEGRTAQHYKLQEGMQRQLRDLELKITKAINLISKGNSERRNDALSKLGSSSTGVGEVDDEKLKGMIS